MATSSGVLEFIANKQWSSSEFLNCNVDLFKGKRAPAALKEVQKHTGQEEDKIDRTDYVKTKPGIHFTEKMMGKYKPSSNGTEVPFKCTLTVESDDVERMINCDPNHAATLSGTVTCPAFSSDSITVSQGQFQLLCQNADQADTREMVYKMVLTRKGGKEYSFEGVKFIHKGRFGETALKDATTLFVKVYRRCEIEKELLGEATLYITLPNIAKQLGMIEITNTQSEREKLHWMSQFGGLFATSLWAVYGPTSPRDKHFNTDASPRKKRPLKLNGCIPEIINCITKDKFEIVLTRYKGGTKGPVVLFHGVGVSSGIFSLDTIDTNLLEYLVQHRYDVWLVDWRTSCNLPSMARRDYTLDDCAANDYPAAIDKVIEITKQLTTDRYPDYVPTNVDSLLMFFGTTDGHQQGPQFQSLMNLVMESRRLEKDVQIVAHCAGSLVCFASLLLGALDGKTRNVVASQVAANPIPSQYNKLKAGLHIPEVSDALGIKGMTVDTDDQASWIDQLFNKFVKGVDRVFLPYCELCQNPVCHRVSFMYGLLWEHEQLNELTHGSLQEFFGYATSEVIEQLAITMREHKLVSASGKDIYLPDVDKEKRLQSAVYRKHINRLNMPICFIAGEKNRSYLPESTLTTYNLVKEAHPKQRYQWIKIPGYGHLDCIFGKDAVHDVYPHILKALDAHAQDDSRINCLIS